MQLSSRSRMMTHLVGLLLGSMLLTGRAAAQSMPSQTAAPLAPGTFRLTVTERAVSLEAQEASVATIMADIGRRTGIPVVVYPGADARITTYLSRVPLDEALKQLAPNIVILPAQGANAPPHRIAKVFVLAAGQARPPQVDDSATRPPSSMTGGKPQPRAETANDVAPRPTPFQFTFDPSQHEKKPR